MSGAAALEAVPLGRRPEGRFAGGGDSYGLLQIPYMLAKFVFPMMKYEVNRAVGSRLCRSIESPTALRFSLSIAVECRLQASFRILRLHPALYILYTACSQSASTAGICVPGQKVLYP